MTQPYCQSKGYRDIDLTTVASFSDAEAQTLLRHARWGPTDAITCPQCGAIDQHYYRARRYQWRCKACHAIFSVTTGTPLANRKLPYRKILLAIFLFIAAPKSLAANQAHAALGVTLRTAYVLFGKIRESLWEQRDMTPLTGIVHIDGGHFCGKPHRARRRRGVTSALINSRLRNRKAGIVPLQKGGSIEPWNADKLRNRRVVLVLRQVAKEARIGAVRTRVLIVKAETAANVLDAIRANVAAGATIMTDDSTAYARLSTWFDHHTVRHSEEYCTKDGVNQNQAESYIARLRRAEYGVFQGMRPQYFALYAHEMAWREDMRRASLRQKFDAILLAVMRCGLSRAWRGYNQGCRLRKEFSGLPVNRP